MTKEYIVDLNKAVSSLMHSLGLDCRVEMRASEWEPGIADNIDYTISCSGTSLGRFGFCCTLDLDLDSFHIAEDIVCRLLEYYAGMVSKLSSARVTLMDTDETENMGSGTKDEGR